MSLDGYADGGDDVWKLDGRWRFGWIFGWIFDPAVQILLLLCGWSTLSGLTPGAGLAKPTYPPIYLVLKYNKLQFTKILKPKKHAFKPFLGLF